MAEEALELITKSMIPGAHLADAFPIRKSVCSSWYPPTNRIASVKPLHAWFFAKQVQRNADMVQHLLNKPLQYVKTQMVSRIDPPNH